jgi:exosome complex component RRP4
MNNKINEAHSEGFSEDSTFEESSSKRTPIVPGEIIISGEDYLPGEGARRDGNHVRATRFGLAEIAGKVVRVISVFGAFIPRRNNVVIGRVTDITFRGWVVDIDWATNAFLPLEESPRFVSKDEMDQFLAIGDVVSAKIWSAKDKGIDLSLDGKGLGKLEGGFVFKVVSSRVPRVIGKEGSMVNLIKENTGCNITIGQNGWIWIKGPSTEAEIRARRSIEFITGQVFVSGLTEKVEEWFAKNK